MIDLHTHSAASDGTDPPEAIPRLAAEAGLSAVALTDHDTLAGIPEATRAAAAVGVELVPGVELSVRHGEAKLHLLVYFLEPDDGPLQRRLAELRAGRSERNVEILRRLAALGYPLELDEVLAQAKGDAVGRPHIADALVARGWFPDRSAAFAALLRDGGPAYVERRRLEAVEAIELAAASGAVAAVAHPSTISANRAGYADLFRSLAEVGLVGIEVDHPEHDPALRAALRGICASLDLVPTGGSDYHGAGKPGVRLGVGRGDLRVPDEVLVALRARRPKAASPR